MADQVIRDVPRTNRVRHAYNLFVQEVTKLLGTCGPGAAALPVAEKKDKRNALPSIELKNCEVHMGDFIRNVITLEQPPSAV